MSMNDFFEGKGLVINGIVNLCAHEAFELCCQGVVMVDVREDYLNKTKCFNVEKIIYLPFSRLDEYQKILPEGEAMIIADSTGLGSKEAVKYLMTKGVRNIANLAGGIVDWERNGLPVITNRKERLSGSCMCQLKNRESDLSSEI